MTPALIKNRIRRLWARSMEGGRLGFVVLAVAALGAIYSLYSSLKPQRMLTIAVRHGVESVALKKVAERFSREHGITVRIQEFPREELFEREKDQVRSEAKSAFDVILVDDPWMPALMIDPIDDTQNDKSKFRLKQLESDTYEQDGGRTDFVGKSLKVANYCAGRGPCDDYYGVPFVGNSQLFCYNTDRQSNFPKDWKAVELGSGNAESGRLGYVTRIGPDNSIVTDFMPILWAYDKQGFQTRVKSTGSAFGDEEQAVIAFQSMAELVSRQKAGGISVDDFDVTAYLADGRASMGIVWSAWAMALINMEKARGKMTLKCGEIGDQDNPAELGVWLLAIPKTSGMQRKAEEFIKYATSKEQMLIAAAQGNPPPRESVLKTETTAKPDRASGFQDLDCSSKRMPQNDYEECLATARWKITDKYRDLFASQLSSLAKARPRLRSTCWTEIEKALGKRLQAVILTKAEPKTEVKGANEEIAPLIWQCRVPSNRAVAEDINNQ
jgi:multiple sugar transport system substrate-binding protein